MKSETITIRISKEEKEKLQKLATDEMSVSMIVRQAIKEYIGGNEE